MGNYASCAIASTKVVKVVLPRGEIRTFKEPLKVAELMLDIPNFFVVNSHSLQIGRRFLALKSHEDLRIGGVYALFPMKKLNSVIGEADLRGLFPIAKTKSKARVSPEMLLGIMEEVVSMSSGDLKMEEIVEEVGLPVFGHRRRICRSKKPVLETIVEEPIWVI